MLSPATFIGIAKALASSSFPTATRPAASTGQAGLVRHLVAAGGSAMPTAAGMATAPTAPTNLPGRPLRNLPRGSLLDISV